MDNTINASAFKKIFESKYGWIGKLGGGQYESFYLIASNNAIVDSVLTVATDADQSMIRLSSGDWAVTDTPTPGRDNSTAVPGDLNIYNPGVSPVRITEFSSTGDVVNVFSCN